VGRVRSSAIRDLLAVAERPDVVSLAGGLPAPESFPVAAIADATARILAADAGRALQYSTTEGYEPLRAWIAGRHRVHPDRVLITQGSQQALDLVVRTLLDPGARVALVDPGYLGAIQVLHLAAAELVGLPDDGTGIDLGAVARARPDAVYVVPNFHNPTGATLRCRRELIALAEQEGFLLIEDDPYPDLRWAGTAPPARDSDHVVTLGSFSKVLAPGLRVGYLVAPAALIRPLAIVKQALDLNTGTLAQRIVHAVVTEPWFLTSHLASIRTRYRQRAEALTRGLRDTLGLDVAVPDGGMFVWTHLGVDTSALLPLAVAEGVAFVPGAAFAVDRPDPGALRLSFATADPEHLALGVERLARAVHALSRRSAKMPAAYPGPNAPARRPTVA